MALEFIRMRALQLTKAFMLSGLRALVDRNIGISAYTTAYVKTYTTRSQNLLSPQNRAIIYIESKGDENRETVNSAPRI